MTVPFDPYHQWLGIPPSEQPANHYRLLGINLFESDPDVIDAAANRQMVHLRSYQAGKRAALSQKLLNEVAAARVCLLDPARKTAYDEDLRTRMEPPSVAEPSSPPVQISASPRSPSRKKGTWLIAVGLGITAVAVLLALLLRPLPETTPSADSSEKQGELALLAATSGEEPGDVTSERDDTEPSEAAATQSAPETQDAGLEPAEGTEPGVADAAPGTEGAMARADAESVPADGVLPDGNSAVNALDAQPEVVELKVRLPIPSQARQEEISQQLEEAYELSKAESPDDCLRLAAELLDAKSDDPDTRFAALRKAMELASEGGDAALMLQAADTIAADFDVDALSVEARILNTFSQGPRTESRVRSFVESVEPVIDEALKADRCDVALELVSTAYQMCLGSTGSKYRKAMFDRRKEIQKLHEEWQTCQKAFIELEADPNNADAHLVVGQYLCFTKDAWQQGLSHLAQGADEAFKVLAKRDLQSPEEPEEQLALADAWWDLAADRDDAAAAACLARASHWYRKALPQLSGLSKLKVERRLEQSDASGQADTANGKSGGRLTPDEQLRRFTDVLRNAKPVNLGPEINSKAYDSGPALSADGRTLLFHSKRPGGLGESDLWMSVRKSTKKPFGPPVNLGPGINTSASERSPALSADGKLLLFGSDRPGGSGKVDLWMCSRQSLNDPFGSPVNLGRAVNSGEWDFGPVSSTDGLTLFFASYRKDGLGESDLWMCVRKSLGQPFAQPINLSSPINTKARDGSPTLSSDGLWLLFHSGRPGGSGKNDLYMSARASETESFGSPFNLGSTINSRENDYAPTLSSDNRLLVFSTGRPGGQGDQDLWMVELEAEQPQEQSSPKVQKASSVPEKTEEPPQSPKERLRRFTEALRNVRPVNLGPEVNSTKLEGGPALSADGCTLVFGSDRPGGAGKADLWMSERESTKDPFGTPVNLGSGINTGSSESSPALSADGRSLLFVTNRSGGMGGADLWMCSRQSLRNPFGAPVNLGPTANSPKWDSGPVLSADGLTLLFHSQRPGGLGKNDLWMCTRKSLRRPFAPAIRLASPINTEADEGSPTLSSDGLWLLFNADRPGGSGKNDLWMCTRASRKEPFGPPFNLGPTINSSEEDYAPTLSADGRVLAFGSFRPGGRGDQDLWIVELDLPAAEE